MKLSTTAAKEERLRLSAVQLEESLVELFLKFPALCGFSVQHRPAVGEGTRTSIESDLYLTEVGMHPELGPENLKMVCDEIRYALAELIEERPDVCDLVRGRTFARSWQ